MTKRLTTTEVAKELGICPQRVAVKLKEGHFPDAELCECGRTMMIPKGNVELDIKYRGRKKK